MDTITIRPAAKRKIRAQLRWARQEILIETSRNEHWSGYIAGLLDDPIDYSKSLQYMGGYEEAMKWKKLILTKGRPRATSETAQYISGIKVEYNIYTVLSKYAKENMLTLTDVRRMAYDYFCNNLDKIRPV